MCIPVTSRRKVFHPEQCKFTRRCPEVCYINDDQPLCDFRIYKGKNEMRAAKAGIHCFNIVGKVEFQEFLYNRGTKAVIGKERISTPRYYDLWIQHRMHFTG